MRVVVRTLLKDAALILGFVVAVSATTTGVVFATGHLGVTWVAAEFELADGRVLRADSVEEMDAIRNNPDHKIKSTTFFTGQPKGLRSIVSIGMVSFFIVLGAVAIIRGRPRLPEIPWRWRSIALGIACGIGMSAFGWVYATALSWFGGPVLNWRAVLGWLGPTWIVGLVVCVGAPVAEELYFRGRVFSLIHEEFGPRTALIGTTMIFAGSHGFVLYFPAYVVLGAVLAILRSRLNELTAPIVAHMVTNAIGIGLVYFPS